MKRLNGAAWITLPWWVRHNPYRSKALRLYRQWKDDNDWPKIAEKQAEREQCREPIPILELPRFRRMGPGESLLLALKNNPALQKTYQILTSGGPPRIIKLQLLNLTSSMTGKRTRPPSTPASSAGKGDSDKDSPEKSTRKQSSSKLTGQGSASKLMSTSIREVVEGFHLQRYAHQPRGHAMEKIED